METTFILVNPYRQENVGAAARAMNTMGFSKMGIVIPACDYAGEQAMAVAHGSQEILRVAEVYSSTDQVFEHFDFVVGTTGDLRDMKRTSASPVEVASALRSKATAIYKAAILFGTEDYGLSNHDLARCDLLSTVPMASPFPALNLGQSVMVYCYELSKRADFKCNVLEHEQRPLEGDGYRVIRDSILELSADIGLGSDSKAYGRILDFAARLNLEDARLCHYILKRIARWAGKTRHSRVGK